MTRNIFTWLLLTYICYQECRAFIPSRIDWTSLSNQPPVHSLNRRDTPDEIKDSKDSNIDSLSYNDIIKNLRSSWQMPDEYLEKRGYLNKVPKSLISRMREEAGQGPEDARNPKNNKDCCNYPCAGCKPCRSIQKARSTEKKTNKRLDNIKIALRPENSNSRDELPEPRQQEAPPAQSPGFFTKIKNLFSHKSKKVVDEDIDLSDKFFAEPENDSKEENNPKRFYEFKYDDSWLREPDDEESEFYNKLDSDLYTKIRQTNGGRLSTAYNPNKQKLFNQRHLINHKILPKDLNYEEIFKNLTQTDVDYVKSFLKCFKENKSKFIIDYLHVNTTTPKTDSMSFGKSSTSAGTTAKPATTTTSSASNTTSTASKKKSGNETATTTVSTQLEAPTNKSNDTISVSKNKQNVTIATQLEEPSSKTNGTKAMQSNSKNNSDEDIKLDLNVKSNDTGEGKCFTTPKTESCDTEHHQQNVNKISPEKIKFLAHMHHAVHEVGKKYPKNVDLKKIQGMIDQARRLLNPVVLGDGDLKNCTAIRLNGLSFDLEIGGSTSSTPDTINPLVMSSFEEPWANADTEWIENDAAFQYLSDSFGGSHSNTLHIQPPYSDNFLDQADEADGDSHGQDIDKRNGFLTKFTKKREVARSEDEVLSDISSSLDKLNMFNRPADAYDDDYGDYPASDIHNKFNNKEEKKSDIGDDYDDEMIGDQEVELFGRQKKKKKKKKKKNKLRLRNGVDPLKLNDDSLDNDYDEQEPEVKKETSGETDKVSQNENNDELTFSEMKDIKFRVNPEQEEDIQKFFEDLNSPPEIFNFDVDKYIKQPENKVSPGAHVEAAPRRAFYEFIDTPSVENEQIPFIQPETRSEKEARSSELEDPNRTQGKRDLLRQYIKGVSSRLHEIENPLLELEVEGAKNMKDDEKRERSPETDQIKVNNYANAYEALDYNKYKLNNVAEEKDDFVDKFYLLNDGSVQIYEPKHIPKTGYDTENLEIDLDLDKKFRELSLARQVSFGDEPSDETIAETGKTKEEPNIVAPRSQDFVVSNDFGVSNDKVGTFVAENNIPKRKVQPLERQNLEESKNLLTS